MQLNLVLVPQLIIIQQLYFVPSRTYYTVHLLHIQVPTSALVYIFVCTPDLLLKTVNYCEWVTYSFLFFLFALPFSLFCVDLVLPNVGADLQ